MSKLDKCAHRYPDDRPFDCCKLPREQHVPGMSHAFVEPVPQPPADGAPTRRKFEELVDAIGDLPTTALATSGLRPADARPCQSEANEPCPIHSTPAAPPVSGDGDVDEIAERWLTMESPPMGGAIGRVYGAIREALQRGRELGARDAEVRIKPRTETTVKP